MFARGDWALHNGSFWKYSEYYGWSLYINGDYMNNHIMHCDLGPQEDKEPYIWCRYTWKEALRELPPSML